jgi:ornithine--oxo-acid transaminase
MTLNIKSLLNDAAGKNYQLHENHINPSFVKTLRTIGFDRCYTRAHGQYLWDMQNNQYLDMLAGYGVFNMGRNNPDIQHALTEFLNSDYPSLVQMEAPLLSGLLAEQLKARMPNRLDYVFFTNSGTESIEAAIKFARCATGRAEIIHAKKSFHGLSMGSLSINGDNTFKEGFGPLLPECIEIPFNDLEALENALVKGNVAAYIAEPIQGKGVNIPGEGYLIKAAELCRKYGALFIADEVQTGMGRTGLFLALEHDGNVDPDMVVLSKSLSGGFVPVGAVIMRKWIYKKVFSSMDRSVIHSSTFGQGSLAMVAGLASLEYLDEKKLLENSVRIGNIIGNGLNQLKDRFEFIHDIRWRGLMIGIEFAQPKSFSLNCGWQLAHKLNESLFPQAITIPLLHDHRILTQVAGHHIDVIKLIPPLIINETDAEYFLTAFEQVMVNLHKFPGAVWEVITRIGKSSLHHPPPGSDEVLKGDKNQHGLQNA